MKTIKKIVAVLFFYCIAWGSVNAQNETASLANEGVAAKEQPAPASNKPLSITLKNLCEKSVAIFAGPKEEIKDPRITMAGGLSKNTFYLKENEAVCLMTPDKRPIACTLIKPGVTQVEINVSGNGITAK